MNYDNTKIKNLNVLYALYCLYIPKADTDDNVWGEGLFECL